MATARTALHVYTSSGLWLRPDDLLAIDLLVRGAGGAGSSSTGGGGGGAIQIFRIAPVYLPASAVVTVGLGGTAGGPGGASAFGTIATAPGGLGGLAGGAGGLVPALRGGNGGASGQPGESVSSGDIRLLAGGGGGAGSGSGVLGGRSGLVPANTSSPAFWQWLQSGAGGNSGQPGGFPSGGGGANAAGAGGSVTVIEYLKSEE